MKVLSLNNVSMGYSAPTLQKQKNNENVLANNLNNQAKSAYISNSLVDNNYGILQTKPMNVSFKGLPATPQRTLSNKINSMLGAIIDNDIVVVAPSYKNMVEGLKNNLDNIGTILKRVFYIEDKAVEAPVAFKRDGDLKTIINFGEKPIFIKNDKQNPIKVQKGDNDYIFDGDRINLGKKSIDIKDETLHFPLEENYTKMVDFSEDFKKKIADANANLVTKMAIKGNTETKSPKKITFENVGGMKETIEELKRSVIYPIKYPELGESTSMSKSVLLYGPPGTGKSLVAEACANESGAWFKKINASELDSKYVGESEQNWKAVFDEARKKQPAIIFIDEIDAIGRSRNGKDVYGEKTLNTILALMSDVEKRGDRIHIIAATNRPDMLDPALIRPGRIDKHIHVPRPDFDGVADILSKYTSKENMAKDFDNETIAQLLFESRTTGADIASITTEAKRYAMEREHIYEKMGNGTYKPEDLKNLTIKNEDFLNAIFDYRETHVIEQPIAIEERKRIGFIPNWN